MEIGIVFYVNSKQSTKFVEVLFLLKYYQYSKLFSDNLRITDHDQMLFKNSGKWFDHKFIYIKYKGVTQKRVILMKTENFYWFFHFVQFVCS